jgi:hypothetical protein
MPRTNIAVDEETAESLADEASKENKSLYALTNEALAAVLEVCKYGGTPKEVYPSWRFSRILKDADAIPLPGDLMEKLIKKMYSSEKAWLLNEWYEEGKRIGSYLRMYAEDFKALVDNVQDLQAFLPVKRIEIQTKEKEDGSSVVVRIIGAGLSQESTSCAERFLFGLLSAYPLRIAGSAISEGMIEVRADEERSQKM